MPRNISLLTPDEMREMVLTFPIFTEQVRARLQKGFSDGRGIVTGWARAVDPSRGFQAKVRAFAKGSIECLDAWEMLSLWAVIGDCPPPRMKRNANGNRRNGLKPGTRFPAAKPTAPVVHRALDDT